MNQRVDKPANGIVDKLILFQDSLNLKLRSKLALEPSVLMIPKASWFDWLKIQ